MYLDMFKITDEVKWKVTHDKTATQIFSCRARLGDDFTQATLALTLNEAIELVDKLGSAIQDFQCTSEHIEDDDSAQL